MANRLPSYIRNRPTSATARRQLRDRKARRADMAQGLVYGLLGLACLVAPFLMKL